MPEALTTDLLTPEEAAEQATAATAANGVRYATLGRLDSPTTSPAEITRLVNAVPVSIAQGLSKHVYFFVPLALSGARLAGEDSAPVAPFPVSDVTLIAPAYSAALADKAICHRNARIAGEEYVFLSSRLHSDRFALAFEFFINVAHNFVDTVGTPAAFAELAWQQAVANIRGETSMDAWEDRAAAMGQRPAGAGTQTQSQQATGKIDEKARTDFHAAAFSDALAIYLLSLYLDFDYADLREREYPLLAAPALAERLKTVNRLFPANDGYKFQILYRRR
ncbi:hypothetical protein [Terriglobus roseus]|uniref:Uncharacterized protein n=1 Tax=Terriglobus roseus TaxID=392734 RepID=A0A1H4NB70_9BACT|nr:hypothetical protein [Terriglobus roseus]SEB92496.1 hypothetical protein SAMN05443244_2197 [Terriglobus roseus]